jgi:sigma-B regulation protein RsbU (phosphoserine phosphatase)
VREHGGPYTADQVDLAEILGRRAGLAVDNARSHEEARAALAARDREAARAELESQRLTALLDQLPVGVILAEAPSGRIVKRNPAVDEIFHEPWGDAEQVGDFGAGRTYRMDGTPLPPDELPLTRAVRRGETVRDERFELRWSDGSASILEVNAGPVREPGGRIFAGVAAFTDVTARTAAERELTAAARRNAELAHTLQANLLPPGLPVVPGLDLAAAYLPVGSGVEVGGDFYDVFPAGRDEEWAVAIGDVCGKGAEAAGITALARHTLQAGSVRARRPSVLLGLLNETMMRQETARPFITAVFGVLRAVPEGGVSGTMAVGGHPLPYVLRADGTVEATGAPGTLVGVLDEAEFHDVGFRLAPGDALVLYTDGATEARDGDEQFGEERLLATLAAARGCDAEGIVTAVVDAIRSFQSGSPRDDLALLVVRAAT